MLNVNFLYSEIQALLEEFPCQIKLNVAITIVHCNKFCLTLSKQHLIWFVKKDPDKRLIPVAHITLLKAHKWQQFAVCKMSLQTADSITLINKIKLCNWALALPHISETHTHWYKILHTE
jgi:hypothetical protein